MKNIFLIAILVMIRSSAIHCSSTIEEADLEINPHNIILTAEQKNAESNNDAQPKPFESKFLASRSVEITGYNDSKGEGVPYQINKPIKKNLTANVDAN